MKQKFYLASAALCALVFTACENDDDFHIDSIPDSTPEAMVQPEGMYVINEDWFGHSNGTVNYFKADSYEATYRAYQAANNGESLDGVTTEHGIIWNNIFYFMSKQGNRLVAADAGTLKKKYILTDIGGDGRMFTGIDSKKAYISTSTGISILDLESQTIKGNVADVNVGVGNMALAWGYVFAVANDGLYIVDTATDLVEKKIEGSFSTVVVSKDGQVWVAAADKLINLEIDTWNQKEYAFPEGMSIYGTSWAWNAGSFCASTQKNMLYWTSGASSWSQTDVIKFDVASTTFSKIYSVADKQNDYGTFYGAGLRVDPVTDNLNLLLCANYAKCYMQIINTQGELLHNVPMLGDNGTSGLPDGFYYWYPAFPVFTDANKPQILMNQIIVAPGQSATIDLNEKVVDHDNTLAGMMIEVDQSKGNGLADCSIDRTGKLTVKAGSTTGVANYKFTVSSQGRKVEKDIQIVVMN